MKGFILIITMFGHDVPIYGGRDAEACAELRMDLTRRYRHANGDKPIPKMECRGGK